MAIIIELTESRDITVSEEAPTVELLYIVHGTEDEQAARALVESTLPAFYVITHTGRPIPTNFQKYQCRHIGGGIWHVNATYGKRSPSKVGQVTLNFDTGGGTTHITQSIVTKRSYMLDSAGLQISPATDQKRAINVEKDRVGGVDIGIPVYKWSETWHLPKEQLTSAYRQKLKAATKTVNTNNFREFNFSEVLFEGVSGIKDSNEDFSELTFHFAQSDNANDLVIPPFTLIQKLGWEYLWIVYKKSEANGDRLQIPDRVYVEQVYEESDFVELGIGTAPLD